MEREMQILNELSKVAFAAATKEYEELRLEVEIEEDWIDAVFLQTAGGRTESLQGVGREPDRSLLQLSYDLRDAIRSQNGGELKKYILRINEQGRASVNYEYSEPDPA